ncbi:GFA family protein [Acidocella sp. KAb 2-4]|uniref:GFA family protein n=1 Tax=Acidocella sp. KAb 2-4 TaxID=2885158 RepID=UPI001D085A34|nr:GFA family protein [Acidocella sp. KAb 2-4]MCB5944027.1 GFA family protein [Acidocella sp. KAb 2-4]
MSALLEGGCACGQIRYECTAEPLFTAHCHCRDCQQASGGGMATVSGVPSAAFRVTKGTPKSFHYAGNSGKGLDRNFCPNCGARLYTNNLGALPDVTFIAVGSLDDSSKVNPTMHIFTASAQPWDKITDGLPQYPGMPG